jgi:hypothetical protein
MLSRRILGGCCFPWPQKFSFFMVLFGLSDCNVARVLQETPFRRVKPSPGSTNQPTQQVAITKRQRRVTRQNGPGFIRAAESQGKFVDKSRGAGAPFPHRKDAITEGKMFSKLDYDCGAELRYIIYRPERLELENCKRDHVNTTDLG